MPEPVVETPAVVPATEAAPAVPAKFLKDGKPDVDALVKGYIELEKKQGAAGGKEVEKPVVPPTGEKVPEATQPQVGFETYEKEYVEKGTLSDDSYKALQDKHGLTKDVVNDFIGFRKQQAEKYASEITTVVGGVDNYKQVATWANQNLSQADKDAYDVAIKSGDVNVAKMAVAGLKTKYEASMGKDAAIVGGTASNYGKPPFQDMNEAVKFRQNPKYNTDPDYVREYKQRLAGSKF